MGCRGRGRLVVEPPDDGDLALPFLCDLVEGSGREIERVSVGASRANVLDLSDDSLSVLGVLDGDVLSAVLADDAEVGPPCLVNGDQGLGVRVVVSASSRVAVLVEESSISTVVCSGRNTVSSVVRRGLRGGRGGGLGGGRGRKSGLGGQGRGGLGGS